MCAAVAGHKEELDELEKRLDELRRRFDMYFQGSPEQRRPPQQQQAQLNGELRRIREDDARQWNTQDRFRLNQLHARMVSMDRMWARGLSKIEDGVSKRDKFKVEQRKKKDAEEKARAEQRPDAAKKAPSPTTTDATMRRDTLDDLDVDVGTFEDDVPVRSQVPASATAVPQPVAAVPATTPSRPVSRPAPAPAPGPAAGGPGMNEQRLQQLYDVYMQAKRRTGETSTLTVSALRDQLQKQIPAIKAKHGCETVDFKVVLKDGKAMLKAIPK